MFRYTYAVPADKLLKLWDGHTYAEVPYLVGPDGPVKVDSPNRMVRADDAPIVDGVAQVYIGSMGDAIAVLDGLPEGVCAVIHTRQPNPRIRITSHPQGEPGMITRTQYLNGEATHDAYYGQFVTDAVVGLVRRWIGEKRIRASTDPNFNDIPLAQWDALHTDVISLCGAAIREAQGHGASLSDCVCIAKAAARKIKT
jgi:hypothetical protein